MSGPFAGAVMITFLAPAARCFAAPSRLGEEPRRFEDDVHAEVLPRELRGILHRQHLERVAVDGDAVAAGLDVGVEVAEHGVVLEQVRQGGGIGQVVDRDEVDVGLTHAPRA